MASLPRSYSVSNSSVSRMDDLQLSTLQMELFAWWEVNARDLPWRFGRTGPWGVLVSEVMSQQTQMSRVVPYWVAWMKAWPDATSLAQASKAEVITAWGRLGYPRRALRLQDCADVVSSRYDDHLPQTYEELLALPGVGDYTASAVISFAFHHRVAVIDTNIRRVLSRVFLGQESRGGSTTAADKHLAQSLLPDDARSEIGKDSHTSLSSSHGASISSHAPDVGARSLGFSGKLAAAAAEEPDATKWNQAVMELGALVCTGQNPLCTQCPLRSFCSFLALGRPGLGVRRTRPCQRFIGTNRQVRGKILEALRHGQGRLSRTQAEDLWSDVVQLDLCIASLDEDGLIDIDKEGSLSLPS